MVRKLLVKIAVLLGFCVPVFVQAASGLSIDFNGSMFQASDAESEVQHFYPKDSENTDRWDERLSLTKLPGAVDGSLTNTAAQMVSAQPKGSVTVIRDNPVKDSSEHLLVWVSKGDSFLELSANRFLMMDGQALQLTYSRRSYGAGVGPTLSRWMQENGEALEDALVSFPDKSIAQMMQNL